MALCRGYLSVAGGVLLCPSEALALGRRSCGYFGEGGKEENFGLDESGKRTREIIFRIKTEKPGVPRLSCPEPGERTYQS